MNISQRQHSTGNRRKHRNKGTILVEKVEQFTLLNRVNLKESAKLKEFFYTLVNHASKEQRRKISIALARNLYAPRSILIFLALETIDVASPVLLFSQALSEADLRNIISKTPIEHHRVIARRDNLEAETIHRLLDSDDSHGTILNILKQNNSASIVLKDVEWARANGNIPTQSAFVPVAITTDEPPKPLTELNQTKDVTDRLMALANIGGKLQKNSQALRKVASDFYNPEKTAASLISSARQFDHPAVCELILGACNLSTLTTAKYISDGDVGTFACLLYAINIDRTKAARILLLLYPQLGRDAQLVEKVMKCYDAIEYNTVVDFFKSEDQNFIAPIRRRKAETQSEQLGRLLQNRRSAVLSQPPETPETEFEPINLSA